MRRALLLSALVALLCAAPASASLAPPHGDEIPPGADAVLADAAGTITTSLASGTWCGTETAADDVTHQAAFGNAIKLVYAYASDQPNHFDDYKDVIQSDVKAVADAMLAASNGEKTVRFDLGTSCGPEYVDIQSVALPRTRATYQAMGSSARFNAVASDLSSHVTSDAWCPAIGAIDCTRDFLVYADGLYANEGVTGTATRRGDTLPSADNDSNIGGQFAVVWGNGTAQFGISSATTAEHEMLHNLGAVQNIAPHSTLGGHCFDEVDVMCYPDGGTLGHLADMITNCPTAPESTIDCGHDDYFNPDGPVLSASDAPMWNVYDSEFLCAVDACGSGGPRIASVPSDGDATPPPAVTQPAATPVPPAAPVTPVKPQPAKPADPLAGLAKAWKAEVRRLLAGQPLRVTYRPAQSGTFTVRLMLGSRVVARASARARAGRRVTATLRLSAKQRRALARDKSRLKLRLAFKR